MAGQGRNADREDDGALGDNVVRFPRDWIGSLDELVPIGRSRPTQRDELEPESQFDELEPESDQQPAVDRQLPLDPDDFWGEQAEMLHHPLPRPERKRSPDRRPDRRLWLTVAASLLLVIAATASVLMGGGQSTAPRALHPQPATRAISPKAATRVSTGSRGKRRSAGSHRASHVKPRAGANSSPGTAHPAAGSGSIPTASSSPPLTVAPNGIAGTPPSSTAGGGSVAGTSPPSGTGGSSGDGGLPGPDALAPAAS